MKSKILIIEDDTDITEVLQLYLQKEGYTVLSATDATAGQLFIETEHPDIVLLDIQLPDGNGFEIGENFRKISNGILIFITGNYSTDDKLRGFDIGADDYITKPFSPKEVVARVKAHLKRHTPANEETAHFADLTIHFYDMTVYKKGKLLENLYTKEKQLLFYLIQNYGRVLSAEQLFDALWGINSMADLKTVPVHISNLRKKIEEDPTQPKFIHTIRGFGYKFSVH